MKLQQAKRSRDGAGKRDAEFQAGMLTHVSTQTCHVVVLLCGNSVSGSRLHRKCHAKSRIRQASTVSKIWRKRVVACMELCPELGRSICLKG